MRLTGRKAVLWAALAVFAFLAAATVYVQLRASRLVSDALTDILGQPVSVGLVDYGLPTGVTLYSLRIANPPGFSKPYLLEIKSINVQPAYRDLLRGDKAARSVTVYGPRLDLERSPAGAWNFQPVLDRLKARPPSRFTIGKLTVRSGGITLPGYGYEFTVPEVKTTSISNTTGEPIGFSLSAGDGKGMSVAADGKAEVFGEVKAVNADVMVEGGNLAAYVKPPEGVDLEDATAKIRLGAEYRDGRLRAALDVGVSGVRSSYYKGKGWLEGWLAGRATYDTGRDTLTLMDVSLDVPGVTRLSAAGTVKDVKGRATADFSVAPSPVELAGLGPYLPAGLELSGRLIPENVRVKGTLRPVSLSATGRARLDSVSAGTSGVTVRGINGGLEFKMNPDGVIEAGADLGALGGRVIGGVRHAGGGTEFKVGAGNMDLSKLGGRLAGLSGSLKVKAEGALKGKGESGALKAKYAVEGSGLSYKEAGRLGSVTVEGEAAGRGGSRLATGTLTASDGAYKENKIDSLGAGYRYADGVLTVDGLSVRLKEFTADLDRVELRYAEGEAHVVLTGGHAVYGETAALAGLAVRADVKFADGWGLDKAEGTFSADKIAGYEVEITKATGEFGYEGGKVRAGARAEAFGAPLTVEAEAGLADGNSLKNPRFSGKVDNAKLSEVSPLMEGYDIPAVIAGGIATIAASAGGDDLDGLTGMATVKVDDLGLDRGGRPLLRGLSCELKPSFTRRSLTLPESDIDFGGSFRAAVSGRVDREGDGWAVSGKAVLPATDMLSLQEGVLEALPPSLKWADVTGTASGDVGFTASKGGPATLMGGLRLSGVTLDMPDKGIRLGPVDGSVPVVLSFGGRPPEKRPPAFRQEDFERGTFGPLLERYSVKPKDAGLTIKRASYGFVELSDISMGLAPGDGFYEIPWFGFRVLGADCYGYAVADYGTGKPGRYAVSLFVDGFSLAELCNTVPGIKGYISGRVDGLARVLVTGTGYRDVSGAGMFWAVEDKKESREISREFLKKLMGPSMKKYMLIGDRAFDTGELDIIFSDGDLVFDNLLLSHEYFFGYRDLHVTVAPVSNKISIEHLLEVIKDVKARAGQ